MMVENPDKVQLLYNVMTSHPYMASSNSTDCFYKFKGYRNWHELWQCVSISPRATLPTIFVQFCINEPRVVHTFAIKDGALWLLSWNCGPGVM